MIFINNFFLVFKRLKTLTLNVRRHIGVLVLKGFDGLLILLALIEGPPNEDSKFSIRLLVRLE
jgi:hypothetical protein